MVSKDYEDGTRQAMTDTANAITVTYTYDKAKRLKTVKRNSATEATYCYNTLGLRTQLTYGNWAFTQYGYNTTTRWLTSVVNKRWTAHNIIASSFVYTHDKVGNRKTMTLFGNDVVTYTYDNIYQLKREQRTGVTSYDITWNYDKVGNRTDQTKNGILTTYTCNDANQLVNDGANVYEYDANGNLITKTSGADIYVWGYDVENRQVSYDAPGTVNDGTYTYDAMGRRIARAVNGAGERYFLDGANVIADYDGSNNLTASYVTPFLDDNLLSGQAGQTTDFLYGYFTDV